MPVTETKKSAPRSSVENPERDKRAAQRLLPEVLRHFDPMIVGRAPARKPVIFFDGQRQVPRLNAYASLQALQKNRVIHLRPPVLLQRLQQNALIVFMLRQRAGNAGDSHRESARFLAGILRLFYWS